MIKKEIAEIKRQFTPANCSISRICGCYVDGEKNKKADFKEAFLSLPEEDMADWGACCCSDVLDTSLASPLVRRCCLLRDSPF